MTRLAWVPGDMLDLVGAPPGVELAAVPRDPLADPRVGEVELFVIPLRPPSSRVGLPLAELWPRMRSLRYVQTLSAGVDWIVGTLPEGVVLCSARGVHDVPVAEWAVAAILAGLKNLTHFRDDMRTGTWRMEPLEQLRGATVLFVGYGSIARAVEERLEPFGPAAVLRVARHAREGVSAVDALPGLLPLADVVVLLLPLTRETAGLFDARMIEAMKPRALLVNAARGGLVDGGALLRALEERRVRAVLDVTDPEPLPSTDPLWRAPGLLITPHVAGITSDIVPRAAALVRDQLERFARDEPLANQVHEGY